MHVTRLLFPKQLSSAVFLLFLLSFFFLVPAVFGQATIATGSIQGTVTDPSGAVVTNAKVTISGKATGQVMTTASSSSGGYSAGNLVPGEYVVRVEAKGFSTAELPITVRVGTITPGSVRLRVGEASQVVEVQASEVQVNTEQASVQGVLTAEQIDSLPINGRNFLDLAQLEPGVQIQDGTNFDPTKVGYSSISFGGRFGRTARIEVDGVDVSDETVGTTTTDIPASAIQEFQLAQSNLDLSTELSSSGAVNVVTRTGSNAYHGEGFYMFRDSSAAAHLPHPPAIDAPYQRHQFGGRFGGAILKDKLFFFLDGERTLQHLFVPIQYAAPFDNFTTFTGGSPGYNSPFKDTQLMARVDYQLGKSARIFYRFNYFQNLAVATFFSASLQPYKNTNYTRNHVVGADFSTGNWSHSFRFSYLKFENQINDFVIGGGLPLANIGLMLQVAGGPQTGPNYLAPQGTPQSNHQLKYDGSKPWGKHTLRYGFSWNHVQGGGFAAFFKNAPLVVTNIGSGDSAFAAAGPFAGGTSNPLNYPVDVLVFGNGVGFSTEHPAFGFPAGGLGPDNRIGLYVGDSWKIRPRLTLNMGLRYVRDTGRTDSDLPAIPVLNALLPGSGNPVRQPNANFAPQAGIAWDVTGSGKTVIRAGMGLFYENVIFNNVLFDRPARLTKGAFLSFPTACLFGAPQPLTVPTTPTNPTGTFILPAADCTSPLGVVGPAIAASQAAFQAAQVLDLNAKNPGYVGTVVGAGQNWGSTTGLFWPQYQTPRSVQMNIGVQHEIRPGMVITADFVRNVTTHFLLNVDHNHSGDIRNFNLGAAQNAIAATLAACGSATIDLAIASGTCPTQGGGTHTATIADFAGNGLGDPGASGGNCAITTLNGAPTCAFGGINPAGGQLYSLTPVGRSVYNGMDVKLTQDLKHPLPGVRRMNLTVSYSLSRFVNPGGSSQTAPGALVNSDQDFVIAAMDNANPQRYMGPSLLDRTQQLSFGGLVDLPFGFQTSIIAHFYSPLSLPLIVPSQGLASAEIFATDFTGDGTTGDPLPGTKLGSFGRDVSAKQLNQVLANYNNTVAGQPTPAGQVLISNGLFTLAQLQALGAVAPTLTAAPAGQVGLDPLRAFDFKLAWRHTFRERWTIEPSIGLFNMFNFANFDLPPNVMSGLLNGSPGSVNGTTYSQRVTNRVGQGTGVFSQGSPRTAEFGVRLTF